MIYRTGFCLAILGLLAFGLAAPPVFAACGDSILDAGEACDDGNASGGDGCSMTCSIEAGWTCTEPVPAVPGSNVVADASFEAGTPNPAWNEFSDFFETPLCNPLCLGPAAPHGAWYVSFFGAPGETASIEQSVTIPVGATNLKFDLFVELCAEGDVMRVKIDDDEVFSTDPCTPGVGFATESVDITAYADGGTHTLRFEFESPALSDISSFWVDQVAIGDNVLKPSYCFELVELACNGPRIDFDTPLPGIPADWSVIDNQGSSVVWSDIVTARENGNYIAGGEAATASSDRFGAAAFDTELRSAPFDLSALPATARVVLEYMADYQNFGGRDFLDLEISSNDGTSWTTLSSWNEDHPASGGLRTGPGEAVAVDLSAFAGLPDLLLRWRYYDPGENKDWYAQIDEVGLTCHTLQLTPSSLATTQTPGSVAQQALTLDNQGFTSIDWTIAEAPATCAAPGDVPWLSVAETSGTLPVGSSTRVTVTSDATGLAEGTHEARLCVVSNDPLTPLLEVPVTLTVAACPDQVVLQGTVLTAGDFVAASSIIGGPDLIVDGPVSFVAGQEISFPEGVEIGNGFRAELAASPCG